MSDLAGLINKGVILNRPSAENGRTFIVTGLYRSGTSLVASMLRQAGIFMGSEINEAVFEDEAIARVLNARDGPALRRFIAERDAGHGRWGFKRPMLCRVLQPTQVALFDRPRVIATFRDPVAMAVRTSLSEYQDQMRALDDAAVNQAAMIAFIRGLPCPNLLLSYGKALSYRDDFIAAIMRFCDTPLTDELRDRLCGVIELERPAYLASARRRFEGSIEGVRGNLLYGWCCLTRSPGPVTLDVLVDGRVALTVVADTFRQDLLNAGFGNGKHGYFIPLEQLHA